MMTGIFLHVLNMSYIGGMVIVAVLAVRLLMRTLPKKFSYALWVIPLLRLLLPFSFESVVSLIPVNPEPIPATLVYDRVPVIDTGVSTVDTTINPLLPAGEMTASVNPLQVWITIGAAIWLIGLAVLLGYGVFSYLRLKRSLGHSAIRQAHCYESDSLTTPFVMGILSPKIFMPSFLTESEKAYILLHEQIHIQRRDHLVRLVSYVALSIHWFNPLVWLAFFTSEKDMEMSCDEAVIQQLGDGVKQDYSASLLSLATGRGRLSLSPLAFGEGETKGRVRNIIRFTRPKTVIIAVAALIVAVVSVGLLTDPSPSLGPDEVRMAMEGLETEVLSISEAVQGRAYQVQVVNSSAYPVYDLSLELSHPYIIPNGTKSNPEGIEADRVIEVLIPGAQEILNVLIPQEYAAGETVDRERLEVRLLGYLGESDESTRIEILGPIETPDIESEPSLNTIPKVWEYEASADPLQVVRSALSHHGDEDYTISLVVETTVVDEAETERIRTRYLGSELAESRGWSAEDLSDHFVVVRAGYVVEYDHTKTFLTGGDLIQFFYLMEDPETGLWTIVDNTGAFTLITDVDPLELAREITEIHGYESFVILSSNQHRLTVLAYHGSEQALSSETLESQVISIDRIGKTAETEAVDLSEELMGYQLTLHHQDASDLAYLVGYRWKTQGSLVESALVIIPKSDLSTLLVHGHYEQLLEQSQAVIPVIVDMTLAVHGAYLSYQDVDEYYKVYDIPNDRLYSVEDQLDSLSVDYSNFSRNISWTFMDYPLPLIYLVTGANGEDLIFDTERLVFEVR